MQATFTSPGGAGDMRVSVETKPDLHTYNSVMMVVEFQHTNHSKYP